MAEPNSDTPEEQDKAPLYKFYNPEELTSKYLAYCQENQKEKLSDLNSKLWAANTLDIQDNRFLEKDIEKYNLPVEAGTPPQFYCRTIRPHPVDIKSTTLKIPPTPSTQAPMNNQLLKRKNLGRLARQKLDNKSLRLQSEE